MMRDAGGSVWGALVFSLAMLSPGYCVGYALNLSEFRTRGLREQMAWSVVLSVGVGTLPLVGIVWLGGLISGEAVLVGLGVAAGVIALRRGVRVDVTRRQALWVGLGVGLWVLFAVGSLVDVGVGSQLWMSVTSYDHGIRTAFVGAVMRTGVVPVNPMYWPGHDSPLRYYYFWYVTCGVVANLAHISARQALIASCVWPLFGVGAMVALVGRYGLEWRGKQLERLWRVSVALLAVTGLDLLVVAATRMGGDPIYGDMEWWSMDQVTSWADTFLWVPHHAMALVCGLLCLLLLWMASRDVSVGRRVVMAMVAGVSFGGAFGMSTYTAVATAAVVGMWVLWRMFAGDRWRVLGAAAVAGVTAGGLLLPYVMQLMKPDPGAAPTVRALRFGLRRIIDPGILLDTGLFRAMSAHMPWVTRQVAGSLMLVLGYGVELGFFAGALVVSTRGWRARSEGEKTVLVWTWSGLLAATVVRSQVIATNDYGVRAMLVPQFFLLLIGAAVLARRSGWGRRVLLGVAAIGIAGSVYQVVLLRGWLAWKEVHHDPAVSELAERNYALRDAYAELAEKVPVGSRVQYDPAGRGYFANAELLNVGRQVVSSEVPCNTAFGGEVSACAGIEKVLGELYPREGVAASGAAAPALCAAIGARYLVATRWDDVWAMKRSWMNELPVVVERPNVKIVDCGDGGN